MPTGRLVKYQCYGGPCDGHTGECDAEANYLRIPIFYQPPLPFMAPRQLGNYLYYLAPSNADGPYNFRYLERELNDNGRKFFAANH